MNIKFDKQDDGSIKVSLSDDGKVAIVRCKKELSALYDNEPDNPDKFQFSALQIRKELSLKHLPLEEEPFVLERYINTSTEDITEAWKKDKEAFFIFKPVKSNKNTLMHGQAKLIAIQYATFEQKGIDTEAIDINMRYGVLNTTNEHLRKGMAQLSGKYRSDNIIYDKLIEVIEQVEKEAEVCFQKMKVLNKISGGDLTLQESVSERYRAYRKVETVPAEDFTFNEADEIEDAQTQEIEENDSTDEAKPL